MTVAELRAAYPEFTVADFTDPKVTQAIAIAEELAPYATVAAKEALTAHVLAVSKLNQAKPDGGAGEITHERVGSKGLMFKPMAKRNMDVWFTLSPYGRLYMMLDGGRTALPMVV